VHRFPLDAFARTCLLEGVDELGYLIAREAAISAFESARTRDFSLPTPATEEPAHAR
jgi:3-isopropylmalate/(R)-2-methylmalate dehydratase small subunit